MTIVSPMIAWFIVSVVVIAMTVITSHKFIRRSQDFTIQLRGLTAKNSSDVRNIINEKLSPSIHLHDGTVQVARRAARIITEVAAYEKTSDRVIEFFGAASLAATEDELKGISVEPGTPIRPPSRIYKDAIDIAIKKHVLMKRYISLFTENQLRERGLAVQEQYLLWLKHQVQLLSRYDRYELAHVVRAPNWGTNMARIITKKHVMEITGNGKAAIVVTDEHIAHRISEYARESIIGKNVRNQPAVYGNSLDATHSLEEFENYVHMVETTYKKEKEKFENEQQEKKTE